MRTGIYSHRVLAGSFLIGLGAVALWSSLAGAAPTEISLIPCPVHALTGVPCPGCGMTRACVAAARGDWAAAWSLHPFALLLIPLAISMAIWPSSTRILWERAPKPLRSAATAITLTACLGLWLSRIL